jgi:hypothetical protein
MRDTENCAADALAAGSSRARGATPRYFTYRAEQSMGSQRVRARRQGEISIALRLVAYSPRRPPHERSDATPTPYQSSFCISSFLK